MVRILKLVSMSTFTKYPNSAKWLIGVLLVLNILCLAALWFGRPQGHPHQKKHQKLIHQIKKSIPFDDQQLATLDTMLSRHRSEQNELHHSIHKLRIKMIDGMTGNDESTLFEAKTLANQIGNLTKERELNAINHFEKIKSLCNPEQRKILTDILNKAMKETPPKR